MLIYLDIYNLLSRSTNHILIYSVENRFKVIVIGYWYRYLGNELIKGIYEET